MNGRNGCPRFHRKLMCPASHAIPASLRQLGSATSTTVSCTRSSPLMPPRARIPPDPGLTLTTAAAKWAASRGRLPFGLAHLTRAGGSPRPRAPRTHDPRGPWPSAPTSGRRRCRGAAPGGSAALGGSPTRRTRGARVVSTFGNVVGQRDAPVLASCWTGCGVRNRFDRMRSAPGVPGADRPWGDRAAVPCRPVTHAGARSHDVPAVRHTLQRSHAWFPSRSAPGWHGHRYQRSPAGRGHVPYG